ncbi:MAG: cytochrome c biogenesis CcdA family protein [Dehalococcoidia bacterium]
MLTEGWVDYLTGPFGIVFAFAAGIVSFLSPCVLPLVPAYIAHLTGVASDPTANPGRRETVTHALFFVLGFGLVFTFLGISVALVGSAVRDQLPTLNKIAGIFLVILGLNLMGVIRLPWLYRTYALGSGTAAPQPALAMAGTGGSGGGGTAMTAVAVQSTALSYVRSVGFGASFAVAWTPCIGPVLSAVLALAGASSTVHQGAYLLVAYSAGLGVPFIITGFALGTVTATLRKFHRFLPALEITTGALIVIVGILIFTNEFTALNQYFNLIPELNSV